MKIPDEIMRKIKEKAATEWPDDYVMQKYVVDEQANAWLELNSSSSSSYSVSSEEIDDFSNNYETFNGAIKWFRPDKEFGFITQDNGTDVFLHISMIENLNGEIYEGRKVKFSKIEEEQGPVAVNVVLL